MHERKRLCFMFLMCKLCVLKIALTEYLTWGLFERWLWCWMNPVKYTHRNLKQTSQESNLQDVEKHNIEIVCLNKHKINKNIFLWAWKWSILKETHMKLMFQGTESSKKVSLFSYFGILRIFFLFLNDFMPFSYKKSSLFLIDKLSLHHFFNFHISIILSCNSSLLLFN